MSFDSSCETANFVRDSLQAEKNENFLFKRQAGKSPPPLDLRPEELLDFVSSWMLTTHRLASGIDPTFRSAYGA